MPRAAKNPPASPLRYDALSEEARHVAHGMVQHCLEHRLCMGMDEGFASFNPDIEHPFVIELRRFAHHIPSEPVAPNPLLLLAEFLASPACDLDMEHEISLDTAVKAIAFALNKASVAKPQS